MSPIPLPVSPLPGADQPGSAAEAAQANFDALAINAAPITAVSATVVSSLPTTPIDGLEIAVRLDSAGATGGPVEWRLCYRADSSSTFKWGFVGGNGLLAQIVTQEAIANAAYVDAPTPGPSITVPFAGDYDIRFGLMIQANNSSTQASPSIGGGAPIDVDAVFFQPSTNEWGTVVKTVRKTGLTVGAVVKLQYKNSAAAGNIARRWIEIVPVRVG